MNKYAPRSPHPVRVHSMTSRTQSSPLNAERYAEGEASRRDFLAGGIWHHCAESEKIATLEVKYRTSRTNFTHRIA